MVYHFLLNLFLCKQTLSSSTGDNPVDWLPLLSLMQFYVLLATNLCCSDYNSSYSLLRNDMLAVKNN